MSSAGLTDELGDSTAQAKSTIRYELTSVVSSHGNMELVRLPESLSEEENRIIEEHLALYDIVAGDAIMFSGQFVTPAWKHKIKHFDYTLGTGLAFLKEKTGADLALFITGEDVISTSGRKAAFVLAAAFGVAIPLGHSYIIGGLVDLEAGNILWMNHTIDVAGATFMKTEDVQKLVTTLYADYPGLEAYKKAIK